MGEQYNEDEEREIRHKERIERMQREKAKQEFIRQNIRKYAPVAAGAILVLIVLIVGINVVRGIGKGQKSQNDTNDGMESALVGETASTESSEIQTQSDDDEIAQVNATVSEQEEPALHYTAQTTSDTLAPGDEVVSSNAVFIDLATGNVLSQRGYKEVINPASMTKILTVLVAAEHVTNLDDTFTITLDITDYSFVNDCSNVGFSVGEEVTIRDLFYGTILPSGADAAVALATYVAGSHEAFVDMMNEKVEELGLSETAHFTNCVGLYDKEHHCTVYDMAMILEAAINNDLCREVLSAHTYTTSSTEQHPEGITISNWFLRRIEDKDTGGEVICAKTGYVVQSRNCAASFGKDNAGNEYICVTAGSTSSWRCIYDHVELYQQFARGTTELADSGE